MVGWDGNRLAMVLAVLEARCGLGFGGNEVYLNIAGGLRIAEPAADLACALALISALTDRPVPEDVAIFGEIGLSGEIRRVTQSESRLREAAKLGFRRALAPQSIKGGRKAPKIEGLEVLEVGHLQDMIDWLYNESRSNSVPKRPEGPQGAGPQGAGQRGAVQN